MIDLLNFFKTLYSMLIPKLNQIDRTVHIAYGPKAFVIFYNDFYLMDILYDTTLQKLKVHDEVINKNSNTEMDLALFTVVECDRLWLKWLKEDKL